MLLIIFMYSIYYYTSVNFCKNILFLQCVENHNAWLESTVLSFRTIFPFIQKPIFWSFALHKRSGNRMDKEKKWNKEKEKREMCSDIYVRRFRRDRPEENLPRFYFPSLECPSLSPSFVCISSAAIHSRRLSRTTEAPSQLRSECNHLGCRDSVRIQIQLARFSFRSAYVSDFILIMAP